MAATSAEVATYTNVANWPSNEGQAQEDGASRENCVNNDIGIVDVRPSYRFRGDIVFSIGIIDITRTDVIIGR